MVPPARHIPRHGTVSPWLPRCFIALGVTAALLASFVGLWVVLPTSAYYKHIQTNIEQTDDGEWIATVTRVLPRGTVKGRWSLEVWVRRGEASFVCAEPMGQVIEYDATKGPAISYELPPSVARCMNSAPPISMTWTRQVMLWGWVPLAPSETTLTVSQTEASMTETDE